MERREYSISIAVNGRPIDKVIIDPHYEVKHSDSISDELILSLVKLLHGNEYEPVDIDDEFEYFVEDQLTLEGRFYKLIWLLEKNKLYVGVVNAYRRK